MRAYRDLTLAVPDGVSLTSLAVTITDSDSNPVPGFTDLTPDSSGVLDLGLLDALVTGTHPSFEVTAPGTTTAEAAAITAALRFVSDAPELCVTLASLQDCPTRFRRPSRRPPTVPVSDMAIEAETVAIVSDVETPTPLSQAVTRADMDNCLGTVGGTGLRTFPGGDVPISGATVDLVGPDSTIVATTTTDLDGAYLFSNINPADYTVTMAGESIPAVVVATELTTADVNVPVDSPVAGPVYQWNFAELPCHVRHRRLGGPDDHGRPELGGTVGSGRRDLRQLVVVSGEGTWTVTSGGDLKFTPIAGSPATPAP